MLDLVIYLEKCKSLQKFLFICFHSKQGYANQTFWIICVISMHVTFYKAEILAIYLIELDRDLSVKIQRCPANNDAGFNLAKPNGRQRVLTVLAKIWTSLLRGNDD